MSTTVATTTPQPTDQHRVPDATTLQNIMNIAISEDKPIMMD